VEPASVTRIEALTDAVLAMAITLLAPNRSTPSGRSEKPAPPGAAARLPIPAGRVGRVHTKILACLGRRYERA
jgi:hypothetical protein